MNAAAYHAQRVSLWRRVGESLSGEAVYAPPVEIACRFEEAAKGTFKREGDGAASGAVVYTVENIGVGDCIANEEIAYPVLAVVRAVDLGGAFVQFEAVLGTRVSAGAFRTRG